MEKETFMKAPARVQREILFDELVGLRRGLKVSAFLGGFTAVVVSAFGATIAKLTFWN